MTHKPRYVLDTNVIVSALLLQDSPPSSAMRHALQEGCVLLSHDTTRELHDVLARPAFDRYITADERIQFLDAFVREGQLIDIIESIQQCRDPRDDKFLELAVNGNADCIITGDADLLELHPFRHIAILLACPGKLDPAFVRVSTGHIGQGDFHVR